jgi:D-glycero-D-manno-heptose 1,7-bisphosphate phosphatase
VGGLKRPAAFLDRDGTLNARPEAHLYVRSPEEFVWLPGAPEGAARLAEAGFALAVVSNQRGVARGLVDEATLGEIEARIQRRLEMLGCSVETFRYCPHDLDAGCDCRKPAPGMLLAAARERGFDLSRSWMVGDSPIDVAAGRSAGCRTALIGPGEGVDADLVADSLEAASRLIVERARHRPPGEG